MELVKTITRTIVRWRVEWRVCGELSANQPPAKCSELHGKPAAVAGVASFPPKLSLSRVGAQVGTQGIVSTTDNPPHPPLSEEMVMKSTGYRWLVSDRTRHHSPPDRPLDKMGSSKNASESANIGSVAGTDQTRHLAPKRPGAPLPRAGTDSPRRSDIATQARSRVLRSMWTAAVQLPTKWTAAVQMGDLR